MTILKSLANVLVLCALPLLAACATQSLESQAKTQERSQARIYFLRESSLLYMAGTPNLKVNDQEVGRVANGSSFFVDRPPGTYKITLETPMAVGRYAAEVKLRAGAVYYVKISPRAGNYVVGLAAGLAGQLLEAAVSENSGPYSVTPVDEKTGSALLQQVNHG
jgi:hypothetical protein